MNFLKILGKSNPFTIKIISILFCIIATILSLKLISYIFSKICTKKRKIFLCTLNSILILLILIEYLFIINKNNIIINLICLCTLIYLLINEKLYIKAYAELENSYKKIKTLETYNKTLNTKFDELSSFQHDFNNIIQTIGGLLLIDKYDNLKSYYKSLKVDCQTINDLEKLNPTKIKNPEILTLLANKYDLAKQNGIRINLDVYSDLSNIKSDIFQIIRILGILIDNAIEATKECDDKILNIEFSLEQNTEFIIIENSYKNKNVNLNNIFNKGFSTKPGNKGLGLWKVNKIIEQNKKFELHTYIDDNLFKQKFEILLS